MNKLFSTIMSVCLACNVQATDLFKTSQDIALRAPSVPLITSDTYLAIWSPYNELNEGNTEHWTAATHPLLGALRVDGKVYRFMGKDKLNLETILPMTNTERWEAKFTMSQPAANWIQPQFDDSGWTKGKAAFGTKDMKRIGTEWNTEDIWVRRSFNLNQDLTNDIIYLRYSHDDVFELYLNGENWWQPIIPGMTMLPSNYPHQLKPGSVKEQTLLQHTVTTQPAEHTLISACSVRTNSSATSKEAAIQKSVDVLPTQTYYTFTCGPVELDLVFTAPLLMEDLDLISTPINYISYRVRSLDKKQHDVQVYIETTPQLAVHEPSQPTISEKISKTEWITSRQVPSTSLT